MEQFVQAVDASLFVSRAFDDEEYEADLPAAELGAAPVQWSTAEIDLPPALLVVAVGPVAARLAAALAAPGTLLATGDDATLLVHRTRDATVLHIPVQLPDHRAKVVVGSVLKLLQNRVARVVCLAGPRETTALADGESPHIELRWLANTPTAVVPVVAGVARMTPPEICTGVAAAVLEASELRGIQAEVCIALEKPATSQEAIMKTFQAVLLAAGLSAEDSLTEQDLASAAREVAQSEVDGLYL